MRHRPLLFSFAALVPLSSACSEGSPGEAWREASSPIVGGVEEDAHAYVVGVGDQSGPWCSATLISKRTVLTAAHCATGITRVFLGKELMTAVDVDAEVAYPGWDPTLAVPDLAVVHLVQELVMQPAPLYRDELSNSIHVGPPWTFVGFGQNDPANMAGFGIRRRASFPIEHVGPGTMPNDEPYSQHYFIYEVGAAATCFGDSGGPAFYVEQGVEYVAGVASFTSDELCSQFGGHARSDQFAIDNWIQATIDQLEPPSACKNDGACNEACNTGGQVYDADCHAAHCASDGICAFACVAPVDPDCDGATTTTTSVTTTSTTSTTTTSSTTSTTTGGGSGGSGGDDLHPARADEDDTELFGRGCSCSAPASDRSGPGPLAALVALLYAFELRRRRARGRARG